MDVQEANKKIAEQIAIANAALVEAARIAEESGTSFYWDGPTYGMGGYYEPAQKKPDDVDDDDWYPSSDEDGWRSSSHSC